MKVYVTDKTVAGVCAALFKSFTDNETDVILEERDKYQPRLDAETEVLNVSEKDRARVLRSLNLYGGDEFLYDLKTCLKSGSETALNVAYGYARATLENKKDVIHKFSDARVAEFRYLIRKVGFERHDVGKGFLRFTETENGVLYAAYSPDNDVTDSVAPHFLARFGNIPFVIHDVKRNKVAVSDGKRITYLTTDRAAAFTPSAKEKEIQTLWKEYFEDVTINERIHLRQQDGYMPRRYRKFMLETWEKFDR